MLLKIFTIGKIGLQKSYIYEKNGTNVRIVAMVVRSEFRGTGIGTRLFSESENWAFCQGAASMSLNSGNRPEREAAHLFYSRAGFAPKSTGFIKMINEKADS
ncbi:GNAT family N-acetyltransferase [Paenibacillus sinopodophylli]|uniref:GNAT family N-acetyltransferase n=1 Tax=Paenibacillus sinopodophylli TaxID=1837342 RepID=UPI00110D1FCE